MYVVFLLKIVNPKLLNILFTRGEDVYKKRGYLKNIKLVILNRVEIFILLQIISSAR
jgi:hypothetical protein